MRHGQSEMNAQRRVQGWIDSPLNDVGRAQALLLAQRLRCEAPVILYSSPLSRARETAEIIAAQLDVPVGVDERLKERGVGVIAGMNNEEIEARFPDWVAQWRVTGGDTPPPGSEPRKGFWGRVAGVFAEIVARHPNDVVAVVSHGGTIGTYLSQLVGLEDFRKRSSFRLSNCSLSIVEIGDMRPRIVLVGDSCHLEREER
jgi:broad specificity phosphatase PhoE